MYIVYTFVDVVELVKELDAYGSTDGVCSVSDMAEDKMIQWKKQKLELERENC